MPLFHLLERDHPEIIKCMARRHLMYNDELSYIAQEEAKGNTMILCPDRPLKIGRTEQKEQKMRQVYEAGRTCALENLDEMRDFLAR